MDTGEVRTRVLVKILLLISLCGVIGEPLHVYDTVVDLLGALNLSQPISGVSWEQTTTGILYKLRSRAPYLTLPSEYSQLISSNNGNSLGVLLKGLQTSNPPATLLSLSSSSSPILQITSSSKTLSVVYRSSGAVQKLSTLVFPRRNPFAAQDLVRLAISVKPEMVTFFVECEEPVVVQIASKERINLTLPGDVLVTLGSTPGRKHSKFTGYLLAAELSLEAYEKREWDCNSSDSDDTDQPIFSLKSANGTTSHQNAPSSKLQKNIKSNNVQEEQREQQHRGVVLGPPSPPQGSKTDSAQGEDRLKSLEVKLSQLTQMVDMMKAQNVELQTRVQYLEGCECVRLRQSCEWEGKEVEEGHRWLTDIDTLCTCTAGEVRCQANSRGCDLDGTIQNISISTTIEGCQTCTCIGGKRECRSLPCLPLDCVHTETVPGECCQKCRGCVHDGILYDHKAKWRSGENACELCYCLEGNVRCETEQCDTPCKNPAAPAPNSCCPVCQDCGVNGHDFPNGASIPTGDRCQECTCLNGDVRCSPLPCPVLSCPSPVHRVGDCCQSCDQCEYEAQLYTEGQKFSSTRDACLQCHCSAGQVSCEHMASSCPPLRCSNPARSAGQCCPLCKECEYERRVYANGNVFTPAGNGPCLQCTCKNGNVNCHQEKCPPLSCSNPIIDPQHCCPICKVCVVEGVEFEEGSEWHPVGPCSSCTCVNGETRCTHTRCPPTDCLHPTKLTGTCCPVCDSCTYNHRIYNNEQRFTSPEQPCQICTCLRGTVECERRACPPVTCINPSIPPGECCSKCPDCSFENHVFVDGETFSNPVNICEECKCENGQTDCYKRECPASHCNAPVPGQCCNNICNGCSYAGKEYSNGQEFPHPTDKCRTCLCTNGNVQCLKKRCPPLHCSNPGLQPGECCPVCPAPPSHCTYEDRPYRHSERFYHPTDSCQSCLCTNGTIQCQRRPCPFASCSHPITQDCCRSCDGCWFNAAERANGETWDDTSDPCAECTCRHGSVLCEKKRCPPSNCKQPVQRGCCMSCDGCLYKGREYPDSFELVDDHDPCSVCHCYRGEVACTRIPCYEECSHPYKDPGQCCAACDRCSYNGAVLSNRQTVPDRENPCSQCTCQSGSMRCERKTCPPAYCPHPAPDLCRCPVCDGCLYQGLTYFDGQTVTRGNEDCQECTCRKGEVECAERRCPAVSCPHPALDSCGCGECEGCNYYGRDCYSGERFPHPTDRCQLCSCLSGAVACAHVSCPTVACKRPVTPPGECCHLCSGDCVHEGREHLHGSRFSLSSDPCSTCSCLNEVVSCEKRPCPVQCSHPVPSDSCCLVCDSCLYKGAIHPQGVSFNSSEPCQRCTCVRGSVTCSPVLCPKLACSKSVFKPGQCCPECPVCISEQQKYREGQTWTPSSNPCSSCTCTAGEINCVSLECPKLLCLHQLTDPGSCCPRCKGCMYMGSEHPEGSSWFADSTPCVTCMCVDGVTTCSEVRCLSPCNNFISVPGECCPVCADCIFEGRVYGPGESFHPADDPCQICTCEVMPDGEQHLKCYQKQCPSLVDCPKSNIHFSGPDSCCPVCAQPLSNCTSALIGNEVLATDDPCFICQCQDLTWTCLHQFCPSLTCPPSEQVTPPDSCCPVCKDCVIEGQGRQVANGSSWTDSDDHCVTCTCNLGFIECSIEECVSVICPGGQKTVKIPGKCCLVCQAAAVPCVYQGVEYQWSERWAVDECTDCTCVFGEVHCHTERCPPLTCDPDEMPAVVPGLCCPHCIPRPATCIAFGDPHYRTFDGRMLHFQGACTYVLAQDCNGGDFSVHATNDERGRKGVSWTKEVTVFIGNVSVQLLQDWVVKVNDEPVSLPFLLEPYIYVERQTNTVLLNTNIGLKVLWSGRSHLEVSVPGTYKSQTCGLCGNFNNYYQDDLKMPSGKISLSESEFGNSWRVTKGAHALASCRPGKDVDPCKDAGFQAKKSANARCKVLKSSIFKACHRVVPPEPWYGACVYDLCACGANADECLCDTLEAYASQCREAGVVLQWRNPSLCAVGCPVERGFVFDECGPLCPVTCFNKDVPLGVIESHCFKPCVPGCQCPAGLVLHNNYCIDPDKCPKIIHEKDN
ncbi:kielin/chordin-like protein [Eucyclogobius newberryi]|uniref:kielin/chordin-like protein n=1 Tax=Eucyclogobius newberryi TaxID=166745 RepID=UPI003B5ABE68